MGQCETDGGKLRVLMYWSAPLSPAQSQWHPFEQEFWGCLQLRREIIKHFGRIPPIIHTDHGSLTRLEYLPLARIEAKHYRWHAEITQGGAKLLYRPGTGALHMIPDGLSRNHPDRDGLVTARIGDWTQHRAVIRGIQSSIVAGHFDDEEPEQYKYDPKELPAGGRPMTEPLDLPTLQSRA